MYIGFCYRFSNPHRAYTVARGTGTNLKVGGAPVWCESGGTNPARNTGKIGLVVPLHFFLALKVQLVDLVSAAVMVSTVWSVYCLLFFYSRCPPCPAICKSGGTCPPCPMESAPLTVAYIFVRARLATQPHRRDPFQHLAFFTWRVCIIRQIWQLLLLFLHKSLNCWIGSGWFGGYLRFGGVIRPSPSPSPRHRHWDKLAFTLSTRDLCIAFGNYGP